MKISCPACNAHYRLPDDRIQGKNRIFKIACKRCGAEIRVRGVETPDEVGRTTLPFALDLPEQAAVAQAPAQIWFAGIQGRQVGPLSEAEVIEHLATGRMGPEDPVWRKGFSAWTPVKDVPPFDDHVAVAPEVPADAAAAPAAKKSSPRRAQTLELSAAMIELLVKLDGQQATDGESAPAAEPPELPPLEPEFGSKAETKPAALDDVATTITASPSATRQSQPQETVKAAMVPAKPASSPKVAAAPAPAAADEPPPAPKAATADPKRASQAIEARPAEGKPADSKPAAEARESSIRIRLPDEAPPAKGRAADVTKVALPGQAAKGDAKTGARPDMKAQGKPEIKVGSGTPAMAPNVSGPVGSAARAASVAANAAVATQPGGKVGATPTQKSGGGAMIGIVLSVVFLAAVVTVFLAMSGKSDRAAETAADAQAVAQAALDATVAAAPPPAPPPVPAPAPAAPEVALAPAPAEDAAATAAAPEVAPAAVAADTAEPAPAAVAVKVDDKAAADKAVQDKVAADKAAADKQKAEADKAAKDEAAKQAADKAKADKEAADKEKAEKAAEAKAKADADKADKAAKAEADKAAKAEKAAADAAKREEAKTAAAEKARKANEDRAAKDADKAAAREKAAADKKAADEKKAQERAAAEEKKAKAAADKKAAEDAKIAQAEAAKQKGNKPKISDEDVEELLRKHDKTKTAEAEDGSLTPGQVAEYGKRATKAVVNCYLLHAEDQGDDTIKVQALVNSSGNVERATVMGKHANNKAMAGCIGDAVKKILFPQSSGASKKYQLAYRVGG